MISSHVTPKAEEAKLASRPPAIAAEQLSIEVRAMRADFLRKYKAEVIGPSSIRFTLPINTSVVDLLNDAQVAGPKVPGLHVTWPSRLKAWESQEKFAEKSKTDFPLTIDGSLVNTNWKTLDEQIDFLKSKSLQPAPKHLLAAAFAAFFIATDGESIFRGMDIRTPEGTLYYGDGGLSEMNDGDKISTCRYQSVMIAALI